jgi:16S rRNA (guanine966-N2)-methyltransferase
MRVIGGEHRSRRLKTLPGMRLRPTSDRLRETLFDVLAPRIEGVVFVDAYAGSGAVGIEALSRGAAEAVFIEKHRAAVDIIRENLKALGLEARAQVISGKSATVLARVKGGIVFLDPPYDQPLEYESSLYALGENPAPLIIAQHDIRMKLKESYGGIKRYRVLRQGDNELSFFAPPDPSY